MGGRRCCCGMVTSALMLLVPSSLPTRPWYRGDAWTQVVAPEPMPSLNWSWGGLRRGRGCWQWKQLQSSQSSDIHVAAAEHLLPGAEQLLCPFLLSFLHRLCVPDLLHACASFFLPCLVLLSFLSMSHLASLFPFRSSVCTATPKWTQMVVALSLPVCSCPQLPFLCSPSPDSQLSWQVPSDALHLCSACTVMPLSWLLC